jgi:hypothetical protein
MRRESALRGRAAAAFSFGAIGLRESGRVLGSFALAADGAQQHRCERVGEHGVTRVGGVEAVVGEQAADLAAVRARRAVEVRELQSLVLSDRPHARIVRAREARRVAWSRPLKSGLTPTSGTRTAPAALPASGCARPRLIMFGVNLPALCRKAISNI